jgi:hypothetical protein
LAPVGSVVVVTREVEPVVPGAPLQAYCVSAISPASSDPLALASKPDWMRMPPPVQLAPIGSFAVATSDARPGAPGAAAQR